MGEICKISSKLKAHTPSNPCLTSEFVLFGVTKPCDATNCSVLEKKGGLKIFNETLAIPSQ